MALLMKKLLSAKPAKPEPMGRADFYAELAVLKDHIHAGHLAILEKLDTNHRELLAALELWSERWLEDHRVSQGEVKSKDVHELRVRARRALAEMARREDASRINGREIFGP